MRKAEEENGGEILGVGSGVKFRKGRNKDHGLLVIYLINPTGSFIGNDELGNFSKHMFIPTFAFSFPFSKTAPGIDYVVRNDYWTTEDEEDEEGI